MKFHEGDAVKLSEEGKELRVDRMAYWKGTVLGYDSKLKKYKVGWGGCELCGGPKRIWTESPEDLVKCE